MLCCPPRLVAFCHRTAAAAFVAKHKCAATLYGAPRGPNRARFSRAAFIQRTTSPFFCPCGYSTHTGGSPGAPPLFPHSPLETPPWPPSPFSPLPLWLPSPDPSLVGYPLCFVAFFFFFFGGFGSSGRTSSPWSLELVLIPEAAGGPRTMWGRPMPACVV